MSLAELISPLIGRWVLAWFFISEALNRARDWEATVQILALAHIPVPQLSLLLALILLFLGGLALAFGYHTRWGAVLLFAFTIAASILMHDFWHLHNPIERAADYDIFARNIAIAGGLLLLVGMGGGPLSLDNYQGGGKKRR